MRNSVINEIIKISEANKKILMLTADLGFSVLEKFQEKFPKRYYNVGICENFMTSLAAGLSFSGFIPITYSIGNFNTIRCLEQIRDDVCYHNCHVIIISVGGGFSYGQLGITHHSTEDISVMRTIPNLDVYVPADPEEALECLHNAMKKNGPSYIRLARSNEPVLYKKQDNTNINLIQNVINYPDAKFAILSTGPILKEAIEAAIRLSKIKIKTDVYSIPTIKPVDSKGVMRILNSYECLITCEENQIAGGLGSLICEISSDRLNMCKKLIRLGLQDIFSSTVGSHEYLCEYYGLSANKIYETVIKLVNK